MDPASRPPSESAGAASVARAALGSPTVLRLVLPVLAEQVLALSVGFTDKWLAGNLFPGAESLAAVGLVAYALGFLPVLFAVPAVAATALVARHVGAGDFESARRAATHAYLLGSAIACLAVGVIGIAGGGVSRLLGLPPDSAVLADRYLAIVMAGLPAMLVIHVGVAVLRGGGDMVAGLVAMSVVNLVNAGLSYALGVGFAGLPRLGWDGLAWGTLAGHICGAACVVALMSRPSCRLRPAWADWRPRGEWLRRLWAVGLPAGIDAAANAACHLAFLKIVNRLGNVDAAAHSVAITIESLAFLPGSAFGVAAATLSGQLLGARDERGARRSVWAAAAACMALMSTIGLAFLWWAEPLAAWFTGGAGRQADVAALTAALVRIVAFAQPPLALLMVCSGGLRGGGATRPPLIVNFLGLAAIRLPLAMLLAWPEIELPGDWGTIRACGLGAVGAWYAMAVDLAVRGVAMLFIFSRLRWSRVSV